MKTFSGYYILKGVLPILLAAICWALTFFIQKYISVSIGPFTITFLSSISAAGFLYLIDPSRYEGVGSLFIEKWKIITIMSLFSVTIGTSAMVYGLQYIDLGIASTLEKTQPIFTVVIAVVLLKETFARWSIILGLIGIIAAIGLIPSYQNTSASILTWKSLIGAIAVTGSAFAWAASGVIGRKLSSENTNPSHMALLRSIIGAIATLPLVFVLEPNYIDIFSLWKSSLLACLGGIIGSGIAYVAYYYGMKTVPAGVASMLELLTPITAIVLGIVFLHENISFSQWMWASVLLGSILTLVWIESKRHHNTMKKTMEKLTAGELEQI